MGFLGDLANSISSQYSLGQNTTTSLDAVVDGQQVKYGSLGDFAGQFDQSAQRDYVEEGYLRRDPYNTDPKQLEILWQEPSATVLVKKRMFSSIAENYRPDYMDEDEKLYYKAMKVLFQNKCAQISALEQLGKIQKMTAAVGNVASQLLPVIITMGDIANNGFGNGSNTFGLFPGGTNPNTTQDATSFFQVVDRLRVLTAYNQTAPYTTWITDSTNLYSSIFGTGTGVMEITNFTNISTSTSIDLGGGSFKFDISDPYESMLITDYDIEIALSDATNLFYNSKSFQLAQQTANQVITDQQNKLNTARSNRNASPITFKIDPNSLLGQRVTVIIDRLGLEIPYTYDSTGGTGIPGLGGFGNSVSVTADYLRGGNIAGYDGLDDSTSVPLGPFSNIKPAINTSELSIFNAIIVAIYQQLQLLQNSAGNFTTMNKFTNYARKKLRFGFSGKLVIQPMDVVNIYMNSKSQFDNKVLAGLQQMFTGFGILQNVTKTLNSFNNATDTLFNPSGNIAVQAEKSIYVGPNFPNYLWNTMRTQFVTEKEGTHVFGGVVEHAIDNWSDGKFMINVDGKDNTIYWDQGKINFKPGADAFNGLIFDPLTPFKNNFDDITTNAIPNNAEFLQQNKAIIGEIASTSLVKYKLGSLVGEKATQGNWSQDQNIDPTTGRLTKVFYAPDGLVYRWKQGIGVFTQSGSSSTLNDPNLVGSPTIYNEPFAGLDVMNVLSLLITGIPYNYATYFKATANFNNFSGDPQSKQSSSRSYLDVLKASLTKSNTLWGDFIPFKNLTMNEAAIAQAMQSQFTVTNANSDLDSKLQQFANLQSSLATLGAVNALSQTIATPGGTAINETTKAQLLSLQSQVSTLQSDINKSISAAQTATKQFYNQVSTSSSYDSNYLIDGKNDPSDSNARKELRKQINYLTRRMSYNVRANQDKNLFIVDDYYDVDYDIAAFNQSLANGIKLYSTEFTSVKDKIQQVANLLNLEVFCDTQGHIRVRSPQYNRMPSSIFYRMLYLKQTLGIQVFPQFLNNLLTNQIESLRQQIEIVEDQIRLNCAILGQYPSLDLTGDLTAQSFIITSNITSSQNIFFCFLSDSTDTIVDYQTLIKQANQDFTGTNKTIDNFNLIATAATSTGALFSNAEKYTVLFNALQGQNLAQGGSNTSSTPTTDIFSNSIIQAIIYRLQQKSGQSITSADYVTSAGPNQPLEVDTGQTIDFFKVTNDLATSIQQWQKNVKAFYHAIKNAVDYQSIDSGVTSGNALMNPGLFHNSYIPEVYEHMIEDETYDDYGLGSGARYIIRNSQIKSLTISENPPPWTGIQVQGTLPFFPEGQGAPGLENFPGGGNGLVTAQAMDYDMWRNYGYKEPAVIKVPFFSDPVTQCGPYASMILTRNRSNILRGNCTISGNEFMQPGEVIYLESRNLLFYVNSVRHNYTEGKDFTTSLELTYGHAIGDYIPTYVDTIGKLFYKNQDTTNTIIQRQDSVMTEQNLGVVQLSGQDSTITPLNTGGEDNQTSSLYTTNDTVVSNILFKTADIIGANNTAGNNITAAIELRMYYNNASGEAPDDLYELALAVQKKLTGGSNGPMGSPIANQPVQSNTLPTSAVNIVSVNMDEQKDPRSPSQQAIDAARNQLANSSANGGAAATSANQNLQTTLFNNIVDCWITFTEDSD